MRGNRGERYGKWRKADIHFCALLMILTLTMGLIAFWTTTEATAAEEIEAPVIPDEPQADETGTEPEDFRNETEEPAIGLYSEPEYRQPAIDIDLVARCIEAEAGTEDLDGKRLVADCIYNMVDCEDYPDNATDVILRPGTFSVVASGRIWKVTPSEESYAAAYMEIENRISWEIMYFRTGHYHNFGTPWGKWGAHYFSTQ